MKTKFIYPSTQLIALLHPKVLKVYLYLLGWQNSEKLYVYTKNLAKAIKYTEKEVEISIQTLIDNNLIQLEYDNGYKVNFNIEEVLKYSTTPIKEIYAMEMLPVSTEITWNKETTSKLNSIEDLSEAEIKSLLLRLQASLQEKEQIKKMVKNSTVKDDLPF